MERIEDPERGDDADDLGRIEPERRHRDVERPPHLALGLALRRGLVNGAPGERGAQRDHQRECKASSPNHAILLDVGASAFLLPGRAREGKVR